MGRKPSRRIGVCITVRPIAKTCQVTNRNPIRGRRLPASGLLTAKPNRKIGAEVDGELGQGQITTLIWGELNAYP